MRLGCQKVRRAHHEPGAGDSAERGIVQPGQSKVPHLDDALAADENVGRLDVAVDNAHLVSGTHGIANTQADGAGQLGRQPALLRNHLGKVRALHEFHHEVELPVLRLT